MFAAFLAKELAPIQNALIYEVAVGRPPKARFAVQRLSLPTRRKLIADTIVRKVAKEVAA
jgi:hypothetical protein